MRYITIVSGLIIFASSFSAFADETIQNEYGVSFGSPGGLTIRKTLSEASQIYVGIGLYSVEKLPHISIMGMIKSYHKNKLGAFI